MTIIDETDIAKLVEELRWQKRYTYGVVPMTMEKAADALRALAQENERLKATVKFAIAAHDGQVWDKDEVARSLTVHSRELEAERDSLKIAENHHHEEFARIEAERDALKTDLQNQFNHGEVIVKLRERVIELKAERDDWKVKHELVVESSKIAIGSCLKERGAIRAKTFKECLELTDDRAECWHTEARRQAARDIGGAISALAQMENS
jgi:hypothetical protein